MREWIATRWEQKDLFFNCPSGPTIERLSGGPNYKGERFAVRSGRSCLSRDTLEFNYEPMPSNRDDAFFKEYRFLTFEEAVNALDIFDKNHEIKECRNIIVSTDHNGNIVEETCGLFQLCSECQKVNK